MDIKFAVWLRKIGGLKNRLVLL